MYVAGSWCDDVVKTLPVAESAAIIGFIVYTLQIHCSNVADALTAAECWPGLNCGQGGGGGAVEALTAAGSTAASLPARAREWRIAASVYNYSGGRSQRVT